MRRVLTSFVVLSLAAGCTSALDRLPKLSDVDIAETAPQADVATSGDADVAAAVAAQETVIADEDKPQRGLLGFLRRQADEAKAEASDESVEVAALQPETAAEEPKETAVPAPTPPAAEKAAAKPRRGLFSRNPDRPRRGKRVKEPQPGAPDYEKVGPGVKLPYGKMARLCGTPVNRLGTEVSRYPDRGKGYAIIDTKPGSTGLRTFFVTGFDDGCARQFSAALALFGSPVVHEQIRYGKPSKTQPISETDKSYEVVKGKVCKVSANTPCGARMDKLAENTVFVSVYETFVGPQRWKNILLHDGEVVAVDFKSRQ